MSTEPIKLNISKPSTSGQQFIFDETAVKEHFSKIEKLVNEVQGKRNYNPFIWLEENVNKLADRFRGYKDAEDNQHKPERTKELQDAILAIPLEIPPINLSKDINPTEYNIHQQRPLGLNLPNKSL